MSEYLLGIDAGNTMIKAVLFSVDGQQVAVSSSPGNTVRPYPGHVERDIAELRVNLCTAISECLNKAGIDPAHIKAIGATGHGNGLYMLDHDEQPLKAIQSIDTRGTELVEAMGAARKQAHEWSLQQVWAAQTPILLKWLKLNDPGLLERCGTFLFCKDVIVHHLTGVISTDISDASIAGLIRFPECRYDTELLDLYDISDMQEFLPPVHDSCEVVGAVTDQASRETGLVAGTPVIAGMIDIVASALGSGVSRVGEASIVGGTWSINQVIVDRAKLDELVFMTTPIGQDRYLVVEASPTSAANLEWFIRELGGGESSGTAEACSEAVAGVKEVSGLPLYHPYLYGSSYDSNALGGFYNLAGWHTRADLLYSLFEGVTFGHRQHLDTLSAAGAEITHAILSGGAARSEIWPQLFADILKIPITTSECPETGALGACIAAAVGLNLKPSLSEATDVMTISSKFFQPGVYNQELLFDRYQQFLDIFAAMSPSWSRRTQ